MKKSNKSIVKRINPIDISEKQNLIIVRYNEREDSEDPAYAANSQFEEEMSRLQQRIDQNWQLYYEIDAAIQRIQNRSLLDLLRARAVHGKKSSRRGPGKKSKT